MSIDYTNLVVIQKFKNPDVKASPCSCSVLVVIVMIFLKHSTDVGTYIHTSILPINTHMQFLPL
jgi:hypothetical protein